MKKWKKLMALLLCLLFVLPSGLNPAVQADAASKSGLVKENGKYYFYNSKGAKVKSKWKSVKAANGTSYRYYFSKDGAAYMGTKTTPLLKKIGGNYYAFNSQGRAITNAMKKINGNYYYFGSKGAAVTGKINAGMMVPAVKKIGGKTYGFDAEGKRIYGVYVILDKNYKSYFYYFNTKTGVFDAAVSHKLRVASAEGKPAGVLKGLLAPYAGQPKEEVYEEGCYGDGKDVVWTYQNFMVGVFRPRNGSGDIVVSISVK